MVTMHSAARKALTILFRRKWLLLSFIFLVTGVASFYIMSIPRVFPANTSVLVKFGREYVYRQEVGSSDATFAATYSQDEIMNSLIEIMRTWGLAEQVVRDIGAATLYPRLVENRRQGQSLEDAALQQFSRDLSVDPASRSNVIWLSYVNEDPDLAADALNRLVEAFQAKHVALYGETRVEFLEEQLGRLSDTLGTAERALEDYQKTSRVYALDEQRTQLLKQQADLDAALKAADNEFEALTAKRTTLTAQIRDVPETVPLTSVTERSKVIAQAEAELLNLRLREQQLATRLGERHPQIIAVRDEIARAQNTLKTLNTSTASSETRGANALHLNLQGALLGAEADLRQIEQRRSGLSLQLAQVTGRIEGISSSERTLRDLLRQRNEAEATYQNYLRKVEEARVSEDMNRNKITSIAVIEPASPPGLPAGPGRKIKLLLVFGFAVLGGTGLAFAVDLASRRFFSAEQIEAALGIPVLATVPLHRS
jgi:uncharacterized protein involved in exopolysaccharide biosynthesis